MYPTCGRPVANTDQSFWPRVVLASEKTVQVSSGVIEPGAWPALHAMFPEGVKKPVCTIGAGTPAASAAAIATAFICVFDTTKALRHSGQAMMATGTFMTTPATGIVVVTIILPL